MELLEKKDFLEKVYHMKEVEFGLGSSLEKCVDELLGLKNKYGVFNGKIIHSNMTRDEAFMEVLGKTEQDHKKSVRDHLSRIEREKRDHEQSIPAKTAFWIEEGKSVLREDLWDEWAKCVPIRLSDLYRGMELKCCLDIIKLIRANLFEEAKTEIKSQGHSGMSFSLVKSMVCHFHEKGIEFFEFLEKESV